MSSVSEGDRNRVAYITCQIIECLAPKIVDEAHLADELIRDLEYHSLALVELAFVLEDAFEFEDELNREATERIVTVGDVVQYILSEMDERQTVFHDSGEHAQSVVDEVRSWKLS